MTDVPYITYMAVYVLSFHILQSNSRTSTVWKLNAEDKILKQESLLPDPDVFNIIASTIHHGKTWIKKSSEPYNENCHSSCTNSHKSSDEYEASRRNSSKRYEEDDEILDCGKAVNFTYYDNLVGVNNRHNHPHVPEPQVALIFKKKTSRNADIDVDALERRLKKAKREIHEKKHTDLYSYCITMLYPANCSVFDKLQKLLNEAMRLILNKPRDARGRRDAEVAIMRRDLGWRTVDKMVFVESMALLFKKPKSVQLYNQIGNFWRIKGDAEKSIECFRRALAVSPHNAEVLLNLARVLLNLQYLDDAIYLTRRSLEVQPPDKNAWQQYYTLGEIFRAYGHYQEASIHMRHSLELKPEFQPALTALKDMEGIPETTVHIYTLLIIVCLVLGVLLVILSSVDGIDGEFSELKTQRHFNRAMAMRSLRMGISARVKSKR